MKKIIQNLHSKLIRDSMLKNVLKAQKIVQIIIMFDLSKLFGSELCQFGIFAHVSDVAPGPLMI